MEISTLNFRGRNPDILTCIANLSSDAVFTPPEFANLTLDTLGEAWAKANNGRNIWADPSVKFLDPFTKSGVFLREITKRLIDGLSLTIPDLEKRVEHILTKQVYGIATESLTAQLSRRSVYCSKDAKGKHSIVSSFKDSSGNIWYDRTEHTWVGGNKRVLTADEDGKTVEKVVNGRCKYCGANRESYERDESLESHAYAFIHTSNIKDFVAEIFGEKMHFDVIIGNPPYQLSDGGYGTSAAPIYDKFVMQAKNLDPRFLVMVIPARWFAGGKGLDQFRAEMLSDSRLRTINDFPDSNDVFPGTQIKGGICYFLWDRESHGSVEVITWDKQAEMSRAVRPLREPGVEIFIRYNEGVNILRKVSSIEESHASQVHHSEVSRFEQIVSSRQPFGLPTNFKGSNLQSASDIKLHQNGGIGYFPRKKIDRNIEWIDKWKVFIPPLGSGSDSFPHPILGRPFLGKPGEACTETYLVIGPFENQSSAENAISYLHSRFLRFLVLLHKPTQHATRSVYKFVPMQDFSRPWSDADLYEKYGLDDDDIAFIERMVRPMEVHNE